MRHTFRRRRHTSNWIYVIISVCFLLVTLCIISLIPGNSGSSPDNTGLTPSPGTSGNTVGSENMGQNSPGNLSGSETGQEGSDSHSPVEPYITITINKEKFSALMEIYQTSSPGTSAQSLEAIRLQLQELALAQEQLTAEREEFRTLYESASEALAGEKNDYLQKQKDLRAESERIKNELDEIEAQLSEYDNKIKELEADRKKLSEEEKELQEAEAQLQHLQEDITHAREQITAERRELESGIQSIKTNPNLSSESKETALLPLYAALEQLLMREAQLEHSEAEYKERSEALLAGQENLASRLQSHEAERNKLDEALAPLKETRQELTNTLKTTEAQLLPIAAELERIGTEETALGKEYQDKLAVLDAEEKRISKEEQTLKKQLTTLQAPQLNRPDNAYSSDANIQNTKIQNTSILAQRTLERILIILQDVSLSKDSNTASDILLTDVADIMITTPETDVEHQDVSKTLPDSSEADSSGSHKQNNEPAHP